MRKVSHRRDIYPGVPRTVPASPRTGEGQRHEPRPRPSARCIEGADWDFATIQRVHDAIEEIALGELGLDVYPNQIEVITAEQMLDAYSSIGMPLFYKHWSFGKHFAQQEAFYRKGLQGLAYEIVINSDPCISYIMEENTATMQTLVIAHAAFGHNHFFKNNYLFKQWTDADGILDYLEFAKGYIAHCEERYGQARSSALLDAAHALMSHGVHRYPRRKKPTCARRSCARARAARPRGARVQRPVAHRAGQARRQERDQLASTSAAARCSSCRRRTSCISSRRSAPRLQPWQREILRIVRIIAQYFYPQRQTKVMNEGCATYMHYRIMNRLHEQGRITDGNLLEFLQLAHQRGVPAGLRRSALSPAFNPYALGFAMMQDIERICTEPTTRTASGSPTSPATGDAMAVLRDVWANYRDESFILPVPQPAPDPRSCACSTCIDDADEPSLRVEAIHDERGYRRIRRALARQYDVAWIDPDIQVVDVDLAGDRRLILHHRASTACLLEERDATPRAAAPGRSVGLRRAAARDRSGTDTVLKEHVASPRATAIAA